MGTSPYDSLPDTAFWRSAVAGRHALAIEGLWQPKFPVERRHKFVTAGSCFAQHIGRALKSRHYQWFDAEPAPPGMVEEDAKRFNYGVFSFRTGNIYTASLLRQWVSWAFAHERPPDELWKVGGRYFDPFRPAIEPNGFSSRREALASRQSTLRAIRKAVRETRFFVFTMGLTESWRDTETGAVYPMCPGTTAGTFDPARHVFENGTYGSVQNDMVAALDMIRAENQKLRFILTVSPVPLTATASGQHVLMATSYSKSLLRAVAGTLVQKRNDTDYFPSYEIISSFPFRGMFYEPNMRSVAPEGVDFVMRSFFAAIGDHTPPRPVTVEAPTWSEPDSLVCEEEILDRK